MGGSGAIRSHLTYANVMATIAVFLALGGGAYAVKFNLKQNQVKTRNIASDAVTGDKALESSFGKVPSAGQADNATNASSATSASTAANAANASLLDSLDSTGFQRLGVRTDDTETQTPSVAGISVLFLNYSGPTFINNLTGGVPGQVVTIFGTNDAGVSDAAGFSLNGPWVGTDTLDSLTVVLSPIHGFWLEVARSNN